MTQYLTTACVHSGNNWQCLHTVLIGTVCTLNWGGWVLEVPNRVNWVVPRLHDKVPSMIGGAMPLLNSG